MIQCKACGCAYNPLTRRQDRKREDRPLMNGELEYCLVCDDELMFGVVPRVGSLQHGSGGGWRVVKKGHEMS